MEKETGLKRSLSLFAAICMMTGCIVGASVFVVPGELASTVGPGAFISYLLGAVLISFSCFMYAQVGSVVSVAGANYVLCTRSVGGAWGFLYVWCFFLGNSFLFPIMAKTAVNYLSILFPLLGKNVKLASAVMILLCCGISLLGNTLSARVQNLCVIVLIGVVVVFSAGGILNADWSNFSPLLPKGISPVIVGAVSTYYAFAGVNCIIDLSGEIKDPGRNIPRTVFISFGIVVVMYIGMCLGLVGLLPADKLGIAAPAVTAGELIFPKWFSAAVIIAAVAACYTTLNAVISSMSRILYTLGKVKLFPSVLAKTNRFAAPSAAIAVLAVLGCLLVVFSDTIMRFVNISSFFLLFIALIVAVGSLRIRDAFAEEFAAAAYKLKGAGYYIWPWLTIVSSLVFMAIQLKSDLKMTGLAILLVPVGIALYFIRKKILQKAGVDLEQELIRNMNV